MPDTTPMPAEDQKSTTPEQASSENKPSETPGQPVTPVNPTTT